MSNCEQEADKIISRRGLILGSSDTSDRQIWGFVDFTWRSLGSGANWVGEQDQRNPQYAKIRRKSISAASQKLLSFPTFPLPDQVRLDQTIVIKSHNGHRSYWPKTGCASSAVLYFDSELLISLVLFFGWETTKDVCLKCVQLYILSKKSAD